jgi:hypothetical protein
MVSDGEPLDLDAIWEIPSADDAPRQDERADPTDVLALAPHFKRAILDQAATWEHSFDAGLGEVVSVSDAANVAARWVLEYADNEAGPALVAEVERLTRENARLRDESERLRQQIVLLHTGLRVEDEAETLRYLVEREEPERDVIEKAKAWRASRVGSFRKEDHALAAAVDALGDSQGDTDG